MPFWTYVSFTMFLPVGAAMSSPACWPSTVWLILTVVVISQVPSGAGWRKMLARPPAFCWISSGPVWTFALPSAIS